MAEAKTKKPAKAAPKFQKITLVKRAGVDIGGESVTFPKGAVAETTVACAAALIKSGAAEKA